MIALLNTKLKQMRLFLKFLKTVNLGIFFSRMLFQNLKTNSLDFPDNALFSRFLKPERPQKEHFRLHVYIIIYNNICTYICYFQFGVLYMKKIVSSPSPGPRALRLQLTLTHSLKARIPQNPGRLVYAQKKESFIEQFLAYIGNNFILRPYLLNDQNILTFRKFSNFVKSFKCIKCLNKNLLQLIK